MKHSQRAKQLKQCLTARTFAAHGNFVDAEMVQVFIVSGEYRRAETLATASYGFASGKFSAGFTWPRWQVVQLTTGFGPLRFLIGFSKSLLMV